MKSLKGFQIKCMTDTGDKARLRAHIFPTGEFMVTQVMFVEPDYDLQFGETSLRDTENYRFIVRVLMMKNSTALSLADMISELNKIYVETLNEEPNDEKSR